MVKTFGKVESHETRNWKIPFHFQEFWKVPKTTIYMTICQIFANGSEGVIETPLLNEPICIVWHTLLFKSKENKT